MNKKLILITISSVIILLVNVGAQRHWDGVPMVAGTTFPVCRHTDMAWIKPITGRSPYPPGPGPALRDEVLAFGDEVPVLWDKVPVTMDHGQRAWSCHGRAPHCGLRCTDVSLGSPKVSGITWPIRGLRVSTRVKSRGRNV